MNERIEAELRQHILEHILGGDSGVKFDENTPLAESGILDSMGFIEFVQHMEQCYGLQFSPDDYSGDVLGTIRSCASFVAKSKASA